MQLGTTKLSEQTVVVYREYPAPTVFFTPYPGSQITGIVSPGMYRGCDFRFLIYPLNSFKLIVSSISLSYNLCTSRSRPDNTHYTLNQSALVHPT